MSVNFKKFNNFDFENIVTNNILFSPYKCFFKNEIIKKMNDTFQETDTKEVSIRWLKKNLTYPSIKKTSLIKNNNICTLIENNKNLALAAPVLLKLDKKLTKKLIRVSKYYSNNSFLFKEISSKKLTQTKEFYFAIANENELIWAINSKNTEDKIPVIFINNGQELLNIVFMHAIKEKLKENQHLLKPSSATLIMSEECNLRCIYCYEPHTVRDKTVITFETAKNALRKFEKGAKVTFFGGEPMLHIDLMKQICEWGWEYRNLTFEMITNGQIIDRDFFRNYAKYFHYVQLSCDGNEIANDINRGHGSHRKIMEFYHAFKEETGRYPTLHPVLSKYSVPFLVDIVKWFYEIETRTNNDRLSLRWLPGDAKDWDEITFQEYENQLNQLVDWYVGNEIYKTNFRIRAFNQAAEIFFPKNKESAEPPKLKNTDTPCAAGNSLFAILPDGTMTPCHHEYWLPQEDREWEIIPPSEDPDCINHMSEIALSDIQKCNTCEQWGCVVCPGSFYMHNKSYVDPGNKVCKAGKLLINAAYRYVEKLKEISENHKLSLEYLATGVDFLLQDKVNKKATANNKK